MRRFLADLYSVVLGVQLGLAVFSLGVLDWFG